MATMSASLEDYLAWREQQDPPIPVVHHIDGDEFDNRPHNICLLCRNCDSQKRITAG